jgi:hypothetical protein
MPVPVDGAVAHPPSGAANCRAGASAPPIPLAEAIATGRLTALQRAALEYAARQNRRSLAAEIRAALHPERA